MNPNSLSKRLLLVIMTPGTIYLSKGELMNIFKAYALIDIQNYTKREIEIIYGTPDNVTPQEFRRLVDKAIDIIIGELLSIFSTSTTIKES